MIHQPRQCHSLLLSSRQHILPLFPCIPTSFSIGQVAQSNLFQHPTQLIVPASTLAHIHLGMRVDDLISERTDAEVWPLR